MADMYEARIQYVLNNHHVTILDGNRFCMVATDPVLSPVLKIWE